MKDCMKDSFFTQTHCGRCGATLKRGRTMSWFLDQTICMKCSTDESIIKTKLRQNGENPNDYEGCGYIPSFDLPRPNERR